MCPVNQAVWLGGSKIYPQAGFWRSSNTTDVFYQWFNTKAWLGYINGHDFPTGECETQYEGPMCGDWIAGYSKVSDFECQKCPSNILNILRYWGFISLMIVIIIILIITTIRGTIRKRGDLSVLYKIFISHVQLLSIIFSFNLRWPNTYLGIFNASKTTGDTYEQFVSFDWLIDQRSDNPNSKNSLSLFYYRVIISFIGPFIF